MSKLQLEIIQKESPQGMGEKLHIISQGMAQAESDQLTDISDQVVGYIIILNVCIIWNVGTHS